MSSLVRTVWLPFHFLGDLVVSLSPVVHNGRFLRISFSAYSARTVDSGVLRPRNLAAIQWNACASAILVVDKRTGDQPQ